jgi:hypothetical protein
MSCRETELSTHSSGVGVPEQAVAVWSRDIVAVVAVVVVAG